ncbi:MAG: hypothetical protein R6V20_08770 [Desulfobia sp.]
MSFKKQLHHILPLLDESLPVDQLAEEELLPPVLSVNNVTILMRPDSRRRQGIFGDLIKTAIRNEELKTLSLEEFSQIMMEWEQSRNPEKYAEPTAPCHLPTISGDGIAYSGKDLLSDITSDDPGEQKMLVIHRDDMENWLKKEGEWPLSKNNLLSRWWPEAYQQESPAAKTFRVTIQDLISALYNDLYYSEDLKALASLRDLIPEHKLPPPLTAGKDGRMPLAREALLLTWCGWCNPPLRIYRSNSNDPIRLDWETAKNIADYRLSHYYTYKDRNDELQSVKFSNLEIDLDELRDFLLNHGMCLPAELFPQDPANCQRLIEIEEKGFDRTFEEEIKFSWMLPRLQKGVIKADEQMPAYPSDAAIKNALRVVDNLNDLLEKHGRTEQWQREACLSSECLGAIDYIESYYRPLDSSSGVESGEDNDLRTEKIYQNGKDPVSSGDISEENIFRKEGQVWKIKYNGLTKLLTHSKGLFYISYLLGSPFQHFHVTELVKAAEGSDREILSTSSGEISDKETIQNYRYRLSEIQSELAEIEREEEEGNTISIEDQLRRNELLEEKSALRKQLKEAVGFGYQLKKNPNEISKQANAVSMAIGRSLNVIKDEHPTLWQHLYNIIDRGEYLSYTPETNTSWITTK